MDKSRKKSEDLVPWLNPKVHVWCSKAGDLTIINLRDPSESLKGASPPAVTTRKTNIKQDVVTALLTKIQSSRRQQEKEKEAPTGSPTQSDLISAEAKPLPAPLEQRTFRPPAADSISHEPVFPEPKLSTANEFEFVKGTNIPGRGTIGAEPEPPRGEGTQCLALFHDPMWGNSSGAWIPAPKAHKADATAKPKFFFDIYGEGAPASTVVPVSATAVLPGGTPPLAKPSSSPAPVQHQMQAAAQAALPLAGYSTVYGLPTQYVAQSAFAPNIIPLNSFQYYQVSGAVPPQPQMAQAGAAHMSSLLASIRPGTNVEAAPFIPGSGKGLQLF